MEYISTFTTGFQGVVKKFFKDIIKNGKIIKIQDGLVYYKYSGDFNDLIKIDIFKNTYSVIEKFYGNQVTFEYMVNHILKRNVIKKYKCSGKYNSFRIRYSKENRFVKVDSKLTKSIEKNIANSIKMKVDRTYPDTEFWLIIRRENIAFFAQLLFKKEDEVKSINKGELKPELAYCLTLLAEIRDENIIYEPFAGYGSIVIQLLKNYNARKLIINDIDKKCLDLVKQKCKGISNNKTENVYYCGDYREVKVSPVSINWIITDPPWGFYEEIENIYSFYLTMLLYFNKILCDDGGIILLTARKNEFCHALKSCSNKFNLQSIINTLVNGKKASVFVVKKSPGINTPK